MRLGCIVFICLFFCKSLAAQTRVLDSLRKNIYQEEDAERSKKSLFAAFRQNTSIQLDTLSFYIQKAQHLDNLSDNDKAEIDIGRFYYFVRTGKTDSINTLLAHNIQLLQSPAANQTLYNEFKVFQATILLRNNHHQEALNQYFNVLKYSEQSENSALQIKTLNNIGWVYMEMNQLQEAIKWFYKALSIASPKSIVINYGVIYANIASCYGDLNQLDSVNANLDKALYYSTKTEDFEGQANALAIKADFEMKKNDFANAGNLLQQAIDIRRTINDPFYIISDLCSAADLYANTGNTTKGIDMAKEALMLAQKYSLVSKLTLIYQSLENNYAKAGDYPNLTSTLKAHLAIKDSIYQQALSKDLAELQTAYDVNKRDRQIASQELIIKNEKYKRKTLIFGIIALFILLAAFAKLYLQRIKAQQQKMQFQSVMEAEQKERFRIARDLHDSIGQMLSVVKMNVSNLNVDTPEQQQKNTGTLNLVDKTIEEVRTISHNLIPEALHFGLISALEEMCQKINDAGSIEVQLNCEESIGNNKFDKQFELSLYRIIQEVVSNMLKHSGAKTIHIQLQQKEQTVQLKIIDDGKGFDTGALKDSNGLGWQNIKARVSLLNGKLHIQSEKIKGTQIEISLPR